MKHDPTSSSETPPAPEVARGVFSHSLEGVQRYATLLAREGTLRGLIGPREVSRLWERHLLNCAMVTDLIGTGLTVCDIGSGAGLPGVVMALRRPDLQVTLVEPLLRRTTFLEEVVTALELGNVEVVRGRADSLHGTREFDVVTSRAVAPMDRLSRWSLPLVRSGGLFLAMKGSSVQAEVDAAGPMVRAAGGSGMRIEELGRGVVDPPVRVVRVVKG